MEYQASATQVHAEVSQRTAEACSEAMGSLLRAVVLTGSMARREATVLEEAGIAQVLGDAEFFLVFKQQARLPSDSNLKLLAGRIQGVLGDEGIRCHVDLAPVHPSYFRRLQPTIFSYELRACGRVVWGDPTVLSLIPPFSAADIPREDAWRLLMNRMIECLEVVPGSLQPDGGSPKDISYRLTKLCLDMATSYLVFNGEFRPTYRARAQLLKEMAEREDGSKTCPLQLCGFSQQLSRCTDFKLGNLGESPFLCSQREAFMQVANDAGRLWRWELTQLTGAPPGAHDWELLDRWMRRQAFAARLRGWLVVLRECGWYRSWRNWPRWLGLASEASPRYWVYAAASELFLSIPRLLGYPDQPGETELAAESLSLTSLFERTYLPKGSLWAARSSALPIMLEPSPQVESSQWVNLAMSIAANYHRFLEHTES